MGGVVNKALAFRKEQEESLGWDAHAGCKHSQAKKLGDVTTLNVTMLKGGVSLDGGKTYALNVIPTEFEAGFDVRISPNVATAEFKAKLDAWGAAGGVQPHGKLADLAPRAQRGAQRGNLSARHRGVPDGHRCIGVVYSRCRRVLEGTANVHSERSCPWFGHMTHNVDMPPLRSDRTRGTKSSLSVPSRKPCCSRIFAMAEAPGLTVDPL